MCLRRKAVLWLACSFLSVGLCAQNLQIIEGLGTDELFNFSDVIAEINTDSDNNLWIVYFGNIQRYDGKEPVFINCFGVSNSLLLRFHEKANGEKLVIDRLNQIFFIEADTLRASAMNDTLKALSNGKFCSDFYFDDEDRLHIAFPGQDYITIDSNLQIVHPIKDMELNGMVCMFNDYREPFTLKTKNKNLQGAEQFFYLLNKEGHVINKCPIGTFTGAYANSLVQLKNGNYLVSSGNGELFEFNADGLLKTVPYDGYIIRSYVDVNGGLWISTRGGIHFYEKGIIEDGEMEEVIENQFCPVTYADFQGGLWIGCNADGLKHIPFPLYSVFSEQNGLVNHDVGPIEVVGDKLYHGLSGAQLNVLDLDKLVLDSIALPTGSGTLFDLQYDSKHSRLWLSQRNRILYRDGDEWVEPQLPESLGVNRCYLKGVVVNSDVAVAGYAGSRFFYTKDTSFTLSEPFDGDVSSLLVVGDSFFVGTTNGLFLQVGSMRTALSKRFPVLKRIIEEMCYFDDRVWLTARGAGLFILEPDSLISVVHNGYKVLNSILIVEDESQLWAINGYGSYLFSPIEKDSGRADLQIEMFAPIPQKGGSQWCATDSALFSVITNKEILRTDFDDIRNYPSKAPILSVTEFKANDEYLPLTDTEHILNYDENFLTVGYTAASYQRNRVVFRYRVLGLKDSWTITNENKLQLIGLAPGEYELELQAQVVHQSWSQSKRLVFEIVAPYWKRTWFIALMVGLGAIVLYLLVGYRMRVASREKKLIIERLMADQKALKAQLNPHFIFNAINSVQYFIRAKRNEDAEMYVSLFSDLARLVLENSERKLVSFRQEMQLYTSQISLESMVLPNGESIDIVFDIDEIDPDRIYLPPALLQPYIENAVWHGLRRKKGERLIKIKMRLEEEMVSISVVDNGIGREAAQRMKPAGKVEKSFGMRISSQRIDVINELTGTKGVVEIEDLKNEDEEPLGTKITLKIPHIQSDEISHS